MALLVKLVFTSHMVPSVLPTSSEPLQQQMFTDTEKNNDINISCARPCGSQAKRTTNLQQHTPIIRLYKTPLRGFWSSLSHSYREEASPTCPSTLHPISKFSGHVWLLRYLKSHSFRNPYLSTVEPPFLVKISYLPCSNRASPGTGLRWRRLDGSSSAGPLWILVLFDKVRPLGGAGGAGGGAWTSSSSEEDRFQILSLSSEWAPWSSSSIRSPIEITTPCLRTISHTKVVRLHLRIAVGNFMIIIPILNCPKLKANVLDKSKLFIVLLVKSSVSNQIPIHWKIHHVNEIPMCPSKISMFQL